MSCHLNLLVDDDGSAEGLGDPWDFGPIPEDNSSATDVEQTGLGHTQAAYPIIATATDMSDLFGSRSHGCIFGPITALLQFYGTSQDCGLIAQTVAAPATHSTQVQTCDRNEINGAIREHAHHNNKSYRNTAQGHITHQSHHILIAYQMFVSKINHMMTNITNLPSAYSVKSCQALHLSTEILSHHHCKIVLSRK